jgi:putative ABC transport system permease protein
MDALMMVLLLFTVLLFGLSGVVVATLITGLLSRHVRQIGAMKAIGASSAQVAAIYALLVLLVAALAVAISLLLSTMLAAQLAAILADLSNVTLRTTGVPWGV